MNSEKKTKDITIVLNALISIQKTDNDLKCLKKTIESLPNEIDAHIKSFEEKKKIFSLDEEKILDIQKKIRTKERDVKGFRETLLKLQVRLNDIKTNKEYSAILNEIDLVKNKISASEDEELSLMEEVDELNQCKKKSEIELAKEKEALNSIKDKNKNEQNVSIKTLENIKKKRDALIDSIEKKYYMAYENISIKRDNLAVVKVIHDICGGCNQKIRAQILVELRRGEELTACPHCLRFLYFEE